MPELEGFSVGHIWVDPEEMNAPNEATLVEVRSALAETSNENL